MLLLVARSANTLQRGGVVVVVVVVVVLCIELLSGKNITHPCPLGHQKRELFVQ